MSMCSLQRMCHTIALAYSCRLSIVHPSIVMCVREGKWGGGLRSDTDVYDSTFSPKQLAYLNCMLDARSRT